MASVIGEDDGRGFGVKGISQTREVVHGETSSDTFAGVAGISDHPGPSMSDKNLVGVFGRSMSGEGVHGETSSALFQLLVSKRSHYVFV
jgi:hypothetical protein